MGKVEGIDGLKYDMWWENINKSEEVISFWFNIETGEGEFKIMDKGEIKLYELRAK